MGQAGVFIVDQNNQIREKKGESWAVVPGGENVADISVGHQTIWVVMKDHTIFRRKSSWQKLPGSLTNVSTQSYHRYHQNLNRGDDGANKI